MTCPPDVKGIEAEIESIRTEKEKHHIKISKAASMRDKESSQKKI